MSPSRRRWLIFGLCAAAVTAALAWVTRVALEVEENRNELRIYWSQQDSLRLALWQMDAALASLMAGESARPYYQYEPFYAENRAFTRMYTPVEADQVFVPSPLMDPSSEFLSGFFRLHFQLDPGGRLSSPQAPDGHAREVAELEGYAAQESIERANASLAELGEAVTYDELRASLAEMEERGSDPEEVTDPITGDRIAWHRERQRTIEQFRVRERNVFLANRQVQSQSHNTGPLGEDQEVVQGGFRPHLFDNPGNGQTELLFVRPVRIGADTYVQGVWVQWRRLREWLIDQVQGLFEGGEIDLVPRSKLGSVRREGGVHGLLASIPSVLVIKEPRTYEDALFTPCLLYTSPSPRDS